MGGSHICKYICRGVALRALRKSAAAAQQLAFRRQLVSEVDILTIEMLRPCESEMHP